MQCPPRHAHRRAGGPVATTVLATLFVAFVSSQQFIILQNQGPCDVSAGGTCVNTTNLDQCRVAYSGPSVQLQAVVWNLQAECLPRCDRVTMTPPFTVFDHSLSPNGVTITNGTQFTFFSGNTVATAAFRVCIVSAATTTTTLTTSSTVTTSNTPSPTVGTGAPTAAPVACIDISSCSVLTVTECPIDAVALVCPVLCGVCTAAPTAAPTCTDQGICAGLDPFTQCSTQAIASSCPVLCNTCGSAAPTPPPTPVDLVLSLQTSVPVSACSVRPNGGGGRACAETRVPYGNNERCSIRVVANATLSVDRFTVEGGNGFACGSFDFINVSSPGSPSQAYCGTQLSSTAPPTSLAVREGAIIAWETDGSSTFNGWLICATPAPIVAGPPTSGTLAPVVGTAGPTAVPTATPTTSVPTATPPTVSNSVSPTPGSQSPTNTPSPTVRASPTATSPGTASSSGGDGGGSLIVIVVAVIVGLILILAVVAVVLARSRRGAAAAAKPTQTPAPITSTMVMGPASHTFKQPSRHNPAYTGTGDYITTEPSGPPADGKRRKSKEEEDYDLPNVGHAKPQAPNVYATFGDNTKSKLGGPKSKSGGPKAKLGGPKGTTGGPAKPDNGVTLTDDLYVQGPSNGVASKPKGVALTDDLYVQGPSNGFGDTPVETGPVYASPVPASPQGSGGNPKVSLTLTEDNYVA